MSHRKNSQAVETNFRKYIIEALTKGLSVKILLGLFVFLGFTNTYAGTSELIIGVCRESSSSGGRACAEGPATSCSGCLRC